MNISPLLDEIRQGFFGKEPVAGWPMPQIKGEHTATHYRRVIVWLKICELVKQRIPVKKILNIGIHDGHPRSGAKP
jgi:hypothetical protein